MRNEKNPYLLRRTCLESARRFRCRKRTCRAGRALQARYKHLVEREETYRQIFENANDAIYLFELDESGLPGRILEVNQLACSRLGYTREEYLQMDPAQLDAPETDVDIPASMDRLREQRHETIELIHRAKDGTRIPVEVSSHLFHVHGKTLHLSIVRDIRERKRAEEEIRSSLREKEILLQEIHHRVKNNLQLVSSILNLQRDQLGNPQTTELQTRVRAMALVHELLYGMRELAAIPFEDYIASLVDELKEVYDDGRTQVRLELDSLSLPMKTAIPLGLLLNEVVSNAFKHAHPPGEPGTLEVHLSRTDRPVLMIRDDGRGLPEEPTTGASLGMVLIDELTSQLGAEVDVSREGGTSYTITIPEA